MKLRAYEMPRGWHPERDEGHLIILIPVEWTRIPYAETFEQFVYRIETTRVHYHPTRIYYSEDAWRWMHDIETPDETWERIFQLHRLADESPVEFGERFYTGGAAHNDRDDDAFLRRKAWNAEHFAGPLYKAATGTLDITMEEMFRWQRPRAVNKPYAAAYRNSLRLSVDKSRIILDEHALMWWAKKLGTEIDLAEAQGIANDPDWVDPPGTPEWLQEIYTMMALYQRSER